MIICKRPDPPDDHLQEARSSGWSLASGLSLQMIPGRWPILWILMMIICKRPDPPIDHLKEQDPQDDHLQEARSSRWSLASERILRIIICKRPNPPDDHLQVARSSVWLFASGRILCMIICNNDNDNNNNNNIAKSVIPKIWVFLATFLYQITLHAT